MPNSIYTPYDPRFNNAGFNQQTGQVGSFGTNQLGFSGSGTSGSGGTSSALPNYNVTPNATGGNGPYGLVPGTIGIPPSTFQQTTEVAPGLGNTTQLTNNIMSELQGDINPQALKNMQDAAASYGVSSGMPGSNAIPGTLAFNKNLRNIGLDTLQVQSQGLKDYLSTLAGIGGQQTPQGLAAEIAAHNAQLRAAPDPQAAAQQQLANYWNALNALRGPGGGTGQGPGPQGGTGTLAPQALGFGFGGYPGLPSTSGQGASPIGTFGGSTATTPGGSSYTWTGQDFGDLFGDPTGGVQTGLPQDIYDFWSGGTPVNPTYDQSAPPQIPSDMSNEDYFYQFGG